MRITKLVSGGQTGVDQTGLEVARELGIETGGWAPKGFLTEDGPNPALADYGLKEMPTADYPPRTRQNVIDSDGTVWFGSENSPGFRSTENATIFLFKPVIKNPTVFDLVVWLEENKVKTLNVAGNRGSKIPESELMTIRLMLKEALR